MIRVEIIGPGLAAKLKVDIRGMAEGESGIPIVTLDKDYICTDMSCNKDSKDGGIVAFETIKEDMSAILVALSKIEFFDGTEIKITCKDE